MKKNLKTLSFFSGCGGLDLGFHRAGFDIVYANELESQFCQTLEANKGTHFSNETTVECKDIRDINPHDLPDNIDFIIGGPPCQTFSASGRRAGGAAGQQDDRGTLFQTYGDIIASKKPLGFLFENVRGILGSNKGKDWEDIQSYFLNIGYEINYRILDACDFGIAQHRERIILVGHKLGKEFLFPRPLYGPDSKVQDTHLSAAEAIDGVIHDENLADIDFVGGKYSHLLEEVPPGDNYLFFTEKRGYPDPVFAYRSRFSDFLYKADPDKPTKTLIAGPGKYTGPLHWDNRYFSIAEYKRLQGFPDNFIVTGNRAARIRQIGNSVSPLMAEVLAHTVKHQIFGYPLRQDIELVDSNVIFSFDKRKGKKAQATRKKHVEIAASNKKRNQKFKVEEYKTEIFPHSYKKTTENVTVTKLCDNKIKITVRADSSKKLFAKMTLAAGKVQGPTTELFPAYELEIEVALYGISEHSIQTMWNAIDDWVIRSSNYHSLFEIYGHFTEPHPDFAITNFKGYSAHPICKFAEFAADFKNCSRFVNREHLTSMFSKIFGVNDFLSLIEYLRNFRYDIRSKEINIAIDKNDYMIAYPFTLPHRKQMNFQPKVAVNG